MFNSKVKFLPSRKGERYASALTSMNLSNKVYKIFGKKLTLEITSQISLKTLKKDLNSLVYNVFILGITLTPVIIAKG